MASLVIKSIWSSYWQIVTSYFKARLLWCYDQFFLYTTFQVMKKNIMNETERGIFSPFLGVFCSRQAYVIVNIWLFLQYCTVFLIHSCRRKEKVSNQGLFILPWTFLSLPNHATFQNLGYYEKSKCRCLHLLLK